jgi:ornithine--oxo-acid transaminase
MIVDEVQTGLGRTGKVLACHHEGVEPDAIILGKALGGGLIPVSAFCARANVLDVFRPGDHGSTFGGNALGAAVGPRIAERPARGKALRARRAIRGVPPQAAEVDLEPDDRRRARQGPADRLEIDTRRASARQFVETLLKHGVLSKDTHGTVARFAPPLIVEREQIDWGVQRICDALREYGPCTRKAAVTA